MKSTLSTTSTPTPSTYSVDVANRIFSTTVTETLSDLTCPGGSLGQFSAPILNFRPDKQRVFATFVVVTTDLRDPSQGATWCAVRCLAERPGCVRFGYEATRGLCHLSDSQGHRRVGQKYWKMYDLKISCRLDSSTTQKTDTERSTEQVVAKSTPAITTTILPQLCSGGDLYSFDLPRAGVKGVPKYFLAALFAEHGGALACAHRCKKLVRSCQSFAYHPLKALCKMYSKRELVQVSAPGSKWTFFAGLSVCRPHLNTPSANTTALTSGKNQEGASALFTSATTTSTAEAGYFESGQREYNSSTTSPRVVSTWPSGCPPIECTCHAAFEAPVFTYDKSRCPVSCACIDVRADTTTDTTSSVAKTASRFASSRTTQGRLHVDYPHTTLHISPRLDRTMLSTNPASPNSESLSPSSRTTTVASDDRPAQSGKLDQSPYVCIPFKLCANDVKQIHSTTKFEAALAHHF